MTEGQHRYVGVAKVPNLRPAETPRVVVDLTGSRQQATATHPAVAASRRPRWRAATLRRIEGAAWVAAFGVVVTIGAFLIGAAPWHATWIASRATLDQPVVPSYPSASPAAVCIFDACARPAPSGPPTRVRITSIQVDSGLEPLRLDSDRHLVPPANYGQAGWYATGVVPGDPGAAVIAGHVDSAGGAGVFFRLHTLRTGDIVSVERGGVWLTFRVTAVEQYPKNQFPTDKVYRPTPDAQLRVITCGGDFDERNLSYRDNIVVYAVAE